MKNLKVDIFKLTLIIILAGFLFIFYQYLSVFKAYTQNQQNGRFLLSTDGYQIIDSQTGALYAWDGNSVNELLNKPIIKADIRE